MTQFHVASFFGTVMVAWRTIPITRTDSVWPLVCAILPPKENGSTRLEWFPPWPRAIPWNRERYLVQFFILHPYFQASGEAFVYGEGNFFRFRLFFVYCMFVRARFVTICVKFRFVRRLELIILDGRFIHLWVASFIKASFVLAAANKLKT